MDTWIKFDQNKIQLNQVNSEISNPIYTEFQKLILKFCWEWMNGLELITLQTSGSTGVPKIITVTRDQLRASAHLTAAAIGLCKNDTSLICLNTQYIAGIMMVVRSLEVGMNMIIVEPTSNPLEKISPTDRIDFAAMVPIQIHTIVKSAQKVRLNEFKMVLVGGAALGNSTIRELQNMACQFYATYGMTETISHIALQKLNGENRQPYFEALPGISLSKDERDCLVIYAVHISDKPIITNDLIEFVTPTKFRWLGRADHVINTGGVKVIPEKIESIIEVIFSEMNLTNRFFVAGLTDELLGKSVTLFIEGKEWSKETEALIQQKLKSSLTRYERPKSIRYVPQFTETETGKINQLQTVALINS